MAAQNLVIVESPGKIKKISEYLGSNYKVIASFGHFRDLPEEGGIGITFENGAVIPAYEVTSRGKRVVADMRRCAKEAHTVYLASDHDREGEAIAWHITQTLGAKHTYKRAVFTEITKSAITRAVSEAHGIDLHLVDAQQARRSLDRVVGWIVSPTLKQGTRNPLAKSAGRVQTPAVRLVVQRERDITNFEPIRYFTIDAGLRAPKRVPPFRGRLVWWNGSVPGQAIGDQETADVILGKIKALPMWWVYDITQQPLIRRAPAPFTTSTLQQAASVEIKWKPKHTMDVAQKLYENGLISYMRTDSVQLSQEAIADIRAWIEASFPASYLPAHVVEHTTKSSSAQEAHEAIRPTHMATQSFSLHGDEAALYDLIWSRTLASQMPSGEDLQTKAVIAAGNSVTEGPPAKFLAGGSVTVFDGWRRALKRESEEAVEEEKEMGDPTDTLSQLPALDKGERLDFGMLYATQRTTKPPPRYTEASLIKALEKQGIGRPSTYATIMSTILDRGYIAETKSKLSATTLGCEVIDYLVKQFNGHMVDITFTARIEKELDEVAAGKRPWQPLVSDFAHDLRNRAKAAGLSYDPLVTTSDSKPTPLARSKARSKDRLDQSTSQDCHSPDCPTCKGKMQKRNGPYGAFWSCSSYPKCSGTKKAS